MSSQAKNHDEKDAKLLNRFIENFKKAPYLGLTFFKLNKDSLRVAVFVDAGFSTNKYSSFQLVFLMNLMDGNVKANIFHYGTKKSKTLNRSFLGT